MQTAEVILNAGEQTLYCQISEKFRKADNVRQLDMVVEHHRSDLEKLKESGDIFHRGTYRALQEAYKYYRNLIRKNY